MEIFNYNWLDNKDNIISIPNKENDDESTIMLADLGYTVRFGTSNYSGYIVTIKDLDTDENVSFNCERTDIEPDVLEETYYSMRKKFAIESNGAFYARKNIRITSVTVPKEKYLSMQGGVM